MIKSIITKIPKIQFLSKFFSFYREILVYFKYLLYFGPPASGFPPKVRSHYRAAHMQLLDFLLSAHYVCFGLLKPSSPTYRYVPFSEAYFDEGARQNPLSRGRITPKGEHTLSAWLKGFNNRRISFCSAKNPLKICIYAKKSVPLQRNWKKDGISYKRCIFAEAVSDSADV